MHQVEHIGERPKARHDNSQVQIGVHTRRVAVIGNRWNVEEQRIDEERQQAEEEEDPVPLQENIASGVDNPLPPRLLGLLENLKPPEFWDTNSVPRTYTKSF